MRCTDTQTFLIQKRSIYRRKKNGMWCTDHTSILYIKSCSCGRQSLWSATVTVGAGLSCPGGGHANQHMLRIKIQRKTFSTPLCMRSPWHPQVKKSRSSLCSLFGPYTHWWSTVLGGLYFFFSESGSPATCSKKEPSSCRHSVIAAALASVAISCSFFIFRITLTYTTLMNTFKRPR